MMHHPPVETEGVKGRDQMDAKRIAEIETELQTAIPFSAEYDPNAFAVIQCDVCNGAHDDHKARCYVPLVYELLEAVKRDAPPATEE